MISRRNALLSTLLGAGSLGLRTLATGLPAGLLLDPRRALAEPACPSPGKAQFVIFATSALGDPINANCPGTYEDPGIYHSPDPLLAPVNIDLGGTKVKAATPWSTLPQSTLDRTCFFHMMTNTPVHPKEPDVLRLMHATRADEMFPSILARQLAPCLGTIQAQPISLGALSPSEGLTYSGQALPSLPALALKATLTNAAGPMANLQALRDQSLKQLYDVYKNGATPAQRAYIDSIVTSQQQVRNIRQDLLDNLASIKDNSASSQILAALTLFQMKVTPVVAIHIPFGGDNHRDVGLANEIAQTVSGVGVIRSLVQQLQAAGLADQVSLASLNVFGRTLGQDSVDGRNHNQNHQVSVLIGKPFKAGVIGGVGRVEKDWGAVAIDSRTGRGVPGGDVPATDTLASYGRTVLTALGVDPSVISREIVSGRVISPAIAGG